MVDPTIGGADRKGTMSAVTDLTTTKDEVCRRCNNLITSPLKVVHYWGKRGKRTYDEDCFTALFKRLVKWRSLRGMT